MQYWRPMITGILLILSALSLGVDAKGGSSSSSGSSGGSKTVHVSGYTRKDGTQVSAYDRAPPGQGSGSSSASAPAGSSPASGSSPESKPSTKTATTYKAPPGRAYRVQDSFIGEVVGVHDGDTITVMREGKAVKVRLYGIDAPEEKRAYGSVAKHVTSDLAFHKNVTVLVDGTDKYGRLIGEVLLPGGQSLNEAVVQRGVAWWFHHFAPADTKLAKLEHDAQVAKQGLWSDPQAVPPWVFRQR